MLADEEGRYESEEENLVAKHKERPVGPPLELEIPLRPPPARPEKVSITAIVSTYALISYFFFLLSLQIFRLLNLFTLTS